MDNPSARPRTSAPRGLGKGLRALIPDDPDEPSSTALAAIATVPEPGSPTPFLQCPIGQIRLNPRQPRERVAPEALTELVASVRQKGILQPIVLREIDGGYELIAGERRYRAAVEAGLSTIPAILNNASGAEALELTLIENLQRVDLNPIEEARGYDALAKDFQLTQEDIATQVGKDRATVANAMRLLKLPAVVQDDLRAGRLNVGQAKVLLSLDTNEDILRARDEILRSKTSVRKLEAIVRRRKQRPALSSSPDLKQLELDLRNRLGTKVRIEDRDQRGTVIIEYYSWNDLNNIVKKILP